MSDTPRSDENPEFRDPTAPSDEPADSTPADDAPADHTAPIDTSATQAVPPMPPAPAPGSPEPQAPAAPATPPGAGYGPPPGSTPQNPYATPQATGAAPHQNPYAAAPPPASPYGQAPYGQSPYGQAPYGAPPAAYRAPAQMSGSTIALLIVAGLTTISCGFGILGLIFGIIAAAKKDEPVESAKFTRWGWIALVAGLVLAIVAAIAFFALIAVGGSTGYSSGY